MDRVCVHARRKSRSAVRLVEALNESGIEAIRLRGSDRAPRDWPIFNFGDYDIVPGGNGTIINRPESVEAAISKVRTIETLQRAEVPTVTITRNRTEAMRWFRQGANVLARVEGESQGEGIRMWSDEEQPTANFYSQLWDKTHEFRVHAFGQRKLALTQKRILNDRVDDADRVIRTYANGWTDAYRLDLTMPDDLERLERLGIAAVNALGLDFGGVDILARVSRGRLTDAVVCEINTGPALDDDRTIAAYVEAIRRL